MKKVFAIFFFSFFLQSLCFAQFRKKIDSLIAVSNKVKSDSDKIVALGHLANIYYTFQLNHKGDSTVQEQLRIADLSENNSLIFTALFGPSLTNISALATSETFDKTISFLQKGTDYAKSQNRNDYLALGYTRIVNILLKRKQIDKALYNASLALQILPNVISDSIKAIIYIELGNAYLAKGEAVSAVRNYNNAFDIAVKLKSIPLQSNIYHCFSEMYFIFFNNKDEAKEFVKTSLQLNRKHNYVEGQIKDYYNLARITDDKTYLEKSISLSNSFRVNKYILQAKNLMLYLYFVVDKNSEKALAYLKEEPEVRESFLNPGLGNYYQTIGHIFYYSGRFDSALTNYKLAEYDLVKNFDESRSRGLFTQIASSYLNLNNLPNATAYYLKALEISKKMNDAQSIVSISNSLSYVYESQGEYKESITYSRQAKKYSDTLTGMSKTRDIVLLNVEREKRKHEEEIRQEEQRINKKRNIQYMAITIAIGVIFIVMLIIGMFPVSKLTIKILGYIFFISLFEFIILIIDTYLHKLTHGEPLKIWLIKIVIIAMLVPIQHYLEHNLIRFLESRKLLKARTKFNIKNWWQTINKPKPVKIPSPKKKISV